jgi:integrase
MDQKVAPTAPTASPERRGTLRKLAGGWEARIRIDSKTRDGFDLVTIAHDDEAGAIERCTALAVIALRLRKAGHASEAPKILEAAAKARSGKAWAQVEIAVDALCTPGGAKEIAPVVASVTFGELAKEWTSGKLHARFPDDVATKRTGDHDLQRMGKWIFPVLEHVPLSAVTLAHARAVLARMPATMSRASRKHVAGLMMRVMKWAVYPCEYLTVSPLPAGFGGRKGKPKAMTCLYPSEDRTLLACTDVPFVHRLFYGFLAREGLRSNEAQSLTWADLDLKRGSVRLDKNKTDDPRVWALDPGVARALQSWKDEHPDDEPTDRIFRALEQPYWMAIMFRRHLATAGVNRPELTERSEVRQQIRVHDLRASFVTVALANGKTEAWIADRTGHKSSAMINNYRRAARTHAELGQGTLTPLDEALGVAQTQPKAASSGERSEPPAREISKNAAKAVIASAALRSSNPLGDAPQPLV